jgi:tRNA threonylcarbamoyladenosine modification (KEOPS) complex  Pcc1 subunit
MGGSVGFAGFFVAMNSFYRWIQVTQDLLAQKS